jgi:hypothetical protein
VKEMSRKKTHATVGEKIFAKETSKKYPYSKMYQRSLRTQNEKINNPTKKWDKNLHRYLNKEEAQMYMKHM